MFSFLRPFSILRSSASNPVRLNNIADNPGARPLKKRVGRGVGSGIGKSAGRGMCGQRQREGGSRTNVFEGGNAKLTKIIPKRGEKAFDKKDYSLLNLNKLKWAIENNKLSVDGIIDMAAVHQSNICGRVQDGVKLLGTGADAWDIPNVNIVVSAVSASAKAAIEAKGGSVKTVYYNRLGLRALLHPERIPRTIRNANPPPHRRHLFDIPSPFPAAPQRELKQKRVFGAPVL